MSDTVGPDTCSARRAANVYNNGRDEQNNALHARPSVWVSIALQIFNNAQGGGGGGVGMLTYP